MSSLNVNSIWALSLSGLEFAQLALDDRPELLGGATVGEALLAPHRSYYELLWPILERGELPALAHITGGGLTDNVPRVLGPGCDAVFDRTSWELPGLFRLLVDGGKLAQDEAFRVFNMGIGMVCFVEADRCSAIQAELQARGETAIRIGEVQSGTGVVRWSDDGGS